MAVLKHNPVSILAALINQIIGLLCLTLTKGDSLQSVFVTQRFGVLEQSSQWISTSRKDEDKRCAVGRISTDCFHAAINRFDKELSHRVTHVDLEGVEEFLRTEASQQEKSVERW